MTTETKIIFTGEQKIAYVSGILIRDIKRVQGFGSTKQKQYWIHIKKDFPFHLSNKTRNSIANKVLEQVKTPISWDEWNKRIICVTLLP
jgi:hypothetical protein